MVSTFRCRLYAVLMKASVKRVWRARAAVHPTAGKRAVLLSQRAAKRGSINLPLVNDATSASRIRQIIGTRKDVTTQLTALQQIAKLMQQQQGQAVTDQTEYRQRLQLARKLSSQLAKSINKMSAG